MSKRITISDITDTNGIVNRSSIDDFADRLVHELRCKAINRKRRDQNGRALGFRAAANIIAEAFELD